MNLAKICRQVIDITKITGQFIRKEASDFDRSKIEYKGLNDPVTYVDKESEKQLVKGLQQILPQAGFITEEGTNTQIGREFNWIVDPLDGTVNFTHGVPIYSISIALQKNSLPRGNLGGAWGADDIVLGVVYEINRDECFHAYKNGGAFCNNKKIIISDTSQLSNSLLATGFPYNDFKKMPQYIKIIETFMQNSHGLRRIGSAAVDLAYVACGIFEGFFEYKLNAWDVAAGALIVKEAGGSVTDFKGGNDFLFGEEIIAAGKIHQEMLDVIMKNWV